MMVTTDHSQEQTDAPIAKRLRRASSRTAAKSRSSSTEKVVDSSRRTSIKSISVTAPPEEISLLHSSRATSSNRAPPADLLEEVGLVHSLLHPDFLYHFSSMTPNSPTLLFNRNTTVSKCDYPFPSAYISDVFDPDFLTNVRSEVLSGQLNFHLKKNDLYHFYQSDSLVHTTLPYLSKLRDAIYSPEFVHCIGQMTGLELSKTIDLSAHRYPHNGYLLCHDDDIGTDEDARVIAFIIYLVEMDWNERSDGVYEGGRLQLFDCDSNGEPGNIVSSLVPRFNSLAYFHVTPTSFHEVEMVHGGRDRVSISGWFHGPKPKPISFRVDNMLTHPVRMILEEWIHPIYLQERNLNTIQSTFFEESYVEMRSFLIDQKFEALVEAWKNIEHLRLGPANQKDYYTPLLSSDSVLVPPKGKSFSLSMLDPKRRTTPTSDSKVLTSFKHFMESDAMRFFLAKMTQLETLEHAWCEFRRFRPLNYTLIHDHVQEPLGLDVIFTCSQWDPSVEWIDEKWGGMVQYIMDTETLLSLSPGVNSFHLVYRAGSETKRFVERLSGDAPHDRFDVIMTLPDSSL